MPNSHQGSEMVQEEGFEPPFPEGNTVLQTGATNRICLSLHLTWCSR